MASDWAVDSSVAAKWVLPEPDSPLAQTLAADVRSHGGRLILLDIALPEVANAIWVQYRRKQYGEAAAEALLVKFLKGPVTVRGSRRLLRPAFTLATRYNVAVYDALFVALTVDLGVPGVTADVPLYNAVHADHPQIHLLRNWPPPTSPSAPLATTPP